MNRDRVQGNWKQFRGTLRYQWARLTDDSLNELAGRSDVLAGKLQSAYGVGVEEAERQSNGWLETISDVASDSEALP